MTLFKTKKPLALLLVLVTVLSLCGTTALAAELQEETEPLLLEQPHSHEHDHESEVDVSSDTPEEFDTTAEALTEDAPVETAARSGRIPGSQIDWELNEYGWLMISGSGGCPTFTSMDDQPWAAVRSQITQVWYEDMEALSISSLAYWFSGCTALTMAEIPYTTPVIGTDAFAGCSALTDIFFYYQDETAFAVTPGAFYTGQQTQTNVYVIPDQQSAVLCVTLYDWAADNRTIRPQDAYGIMTLADCALGTCTCTSCGWYYSYSADGSSGHEVWVNCTNCTAAFYLKDESHTTSSGTCSKCGYYSGSGGGGGGGSVCYHNSTRTSWSGCDWYEYCRSCGTLVDYGTSHGSYIYGAWEYYSSTRHRRLYACSDCGEGSYSYASHSTSSKYDTYSATQHKVSQYCATCDSTISSSYASHSFAYGSWQSYSDTQHRRMKTCSSCGYSAYEYESHTKNYGTWEKDTESTHKRTVTCSCGYSATETAEHNLTYSEWTSASDAQHKRTAACVCGHSAESYGDHADSDDDGSCDDCGYLMTRFSVTVPASLSLTVSKTGAVYAASKAEIVNRSTAAVRVSGITVHAENGWTLVPYRRSMAAEKVDSRQIGFFINGAESRETGSAESLLLNGAWQIAKGASLPLSYDAVVSATSYAISEQVLTVVFVLEWAAP